MEELVEELVEELSLEVSIHRVTLDVRDTRAVWWIHCLTDFAILRSWSIMPDQSQQEIIFQAQSNKCL